MTAAAATDATPSVSSSAASSASAPVVPSVRVQLQVLSGNPALYLSRARLPDLQDHDFALNLAVAAEREKEAADTGTVRDRSDIMARVDVPNALPGTYYIGVFGYCCEDSTVSTRTTARLTCACVLLQLIVSLCVSMTCAVSAPRGGWTVHWRLDSPTEPNSCAPTSSTRSCSGFAFAQIHISLLLFSIEDWIGCNDLTSHSQGASSYRAKRDTSKCPH